MVETYRGVVYPNHIDHIDHIDHMGHMNVKWYVAKFDEATWHLFSVLGITRAYIMEHKKGMVAVEQNIKYKSEALSGDLLFIKSHVLEFKEKTIKFRHIMYNSDSNKELAVCELSGVHFDRETRKACAFPENIFQNINEFISKNL